MPQRPQPDRIDSAPRLAEGIKEEHMLNGTRDRLDNRPSLGALVADIANDLSQLIRGEIDLAKAETERVRAPRGCRWRAASCRCSSRPHGAHSVHLGCGVRAV